MDFISDKSVHDACWLYNGHCNLQEYNNNMKRITLLYSLFLYEYSFYSVVILFFKNNPILLIICCTDYVIILSASRYMNK